MSEYETIVSELVKKAALDQNNQNDDHSASKYYYQVVLECKEYTIFASYDCQKNLRGVIIRYPENNREYYFPPPTRGFTLSKIEIPGGNQTLANILISVTESQFNDIFTTVISDILQIVDTKYSSGDLVDFILKIIRKFQRSMEKLSEEFLTPAQMRGLYGELYFLYYHLMPAIGISAAIDAWVGPKRRQQDFLIQERIGVEVKTTTIKPPVTLSISSEEQLDPEGFDALYLYHLDVIELKASTGTLPELVKMIEKKCSDDMDLHLQFTNKLLDVNYREKDIEHYLNPAYSLRNETLYDVKKPGFPNIAVADLKEGVGDVHYKIQIGSLENYKGNIESVMDSISKEAE